MKKEINLLSRKAILVLLLQMILVTSSQAVVMQTDDSVFGSNTIVQDLDNGLDFLRLDFTDGYSINTISTELGAGGAFSGWRISTLAEMELLGASAGILHSSTDAGVMANLEQLRGWLCAVCVKDTGTHIGYSGLLTDLNPFLTDHPDKRLRFNISRRHNVTPNEVSYRGAGFGYVTSTWEYIYMVRDTGSAIPVTESSSLALLGMGLLGFTFIRSRGLEREH